MHSVNFMNFNIIENRINKVLDVKPLVPFIITENANSLTNKSDATKLGHLNYNTEKSYTRNVEKAAFRRNF